MVCAAVLTAVLAFAVDGTGPNSWSPGGHPLARIARSTGPGALFSPQNVIIRARARQRRRWRRIIIVSGVIGAAIGRAAAGAGSPPRHGQRSRTHHGGVPVPALQAERLPGLAALDKGQGASISGLSCPSAGNCAIDGTYGVYDTPPGLLPGRPWRYHSHVFVASEVHGRWRQAQDLPGLTALHADGVASIGPVSCPSPENCLAVGYYGRSGQATAFLAVEHDGTWRNARRIPGLRALLPQDSTVAVSCSSVGNCAFGGAYKPRIHHGAEAFVDSEINGMWNKAQPVPGLAALASGAPSGVTAISCASPGNCTAGGWYAGQDFDQGGFVVSQTDGVWGIAEQIPGAQALRGLGAVTAISCASAGNCGLTGNRTPPGDKDAITPFVASQVSGTWGNAKPVPGLPALDDHSSMAMATMLSCPAPGGCTAGGYYIRRHQHRKVYPFTVTQTDGAWHTAQQVPGITAFNASGAATISVDRCGDPFVTAFLRSCGAHSCALAVSCSALSCGSVGNCTAGVTIGINFYAGRAFTVTQTGGTWHAIQQIPGLSALNASNDSDIVDVSCPQQAPAPARASTNLDAAKTRSYSSLVSHP
jgi:hypothetical protein